MDVTSAHQPGMHQHAAPTTSGLEALAPQAARDRESDASRPPGSAAASSAGVDAYQPSPEGLAALARESGGEADEGAADGPSSDARVGRTPEEESQLRELQARDREVRAHEQAHLSAAGSLATGGASFTYERGPDGVAYAVGGEVGISLSEGATPEATLQRAQQIQRAALAPAQPSAQDRAVAAQAAQMATQARAALSAEQASTAAPRNVQQAAAAYAETMSVAFES